MYLLSNRAGSRSEQLLDYIKMKHLDTNHKEVLVDEKPLFSSTWLALFTVLRKNYMARHVVITTPDKVNLKTLANKQSDIKLN